MKTVIYIKDMVCPRCISTVENILEKLCLKPMNVELGKATLYQPLTEEDLSHLKMKLQENGFDLLEDKQHQLIEQAKTIILESIQSKENSPLNLSALLQDRMNINYSSLSKLFSKVMGCTIEHYTIALKIEKVKELLWYDELSITQIAYKMGYSSAAHLSKQFKMITGMTPSQFKLLKDPQRISYDQIGSRIL